MLCLWIICMTPFLSFPFPFPLPFAAYFLLLSHLISSPLPFLSLIFPSCHSLSFSSLSLLFLKLFLFLFLHPLRTSPDGLEVLTQPNGLYHLARRLCIVLNQPKLNDVLLQNAVRAALIINSYLYMIIHF